MSGPVVAIGFILLVPSILGMALAALLFLGEVGYNPLGLIAFEGGPDYDRDYVLCWRTAGLAAYYEKARA